MDVLEADTRVDPVLIARIPEGGKVHYVIAVIADHVVGQWQTVSVSLWSGCTGSTLLTLLTSRCTSTLSTRRCTNLLLLLLLLETTVCLLSHGRLRGRTRSDRELLE